MGAARLYTILVKQIPKTYYRRINFSYQNNLFVAIWVILFKIVQDDNVFCLKAYCV